MKKIKVIFAAIASLIIGGSLAFFQGSSTALAQFQYQSPAQNNSNNANNNQQPSGNQQLMPGNAQNTITLKTMSNSQLGTFLVDAKGMTLYTFMNDSNGISMCTDQCANVWPPYVVSQGAVNDIGSNINGRVGTITLADGSSQVTYNGMPLYYYSKDLKQGDTKGQGIAGLWFVAKQ